MVYYFIYFDTDFHKTFFDSSNLLISHSIKIKKKIFEDELTF